MRRFPCGSRFRPGRPLPSSLLVERSSRAGRNRAAPWAGGPGRRRVPAALRAHRGAHWLRASNRRPASPRRRDLPHDLPAVTSGPRSDVGLRHVRVPKLGSYGLGVNLYRRSGPSCSRHEGSRRSSRSQTSTETGPSSSGSPGPRTTTSVTGRCGSSTASAWAAARCSGPGPMIHHAPPTPFIGRTRAHASRTDGTSPAPQPRA